MPSTGDLIEEFEELIASANRCPDWPVAMEDLSRFVRRHEAAILAALRQPTAEPDTAGREAGAAEMRERAARQCDLMTDVFGKEPRPHPAGHSDWDLASFFSGAATAIRSLPLHPEGSERTMGGDDAEA